MLARVPILSHKVTGITSKQDVIYITFCTRTKHDHLPDVRKMVCNFLSNISTSFFSLCYYIRKVIPFAIPQQFLEFSRTPAFHLVYFAGSLLKLLEQSLYFFFFHISSMMMRLFLIF